MEIYLGDVWNFERNMSENAVRFMKTGDIVTASIPLLPGIYHQGIIVDTGEKKLVYHNTPTARNDPVEI